MPTRGILGLHASAGLGMALHPPGQLKHLPNTTLTPIRARYPSICHFTCPTVFAEKNGVITCQHGPKECHANTIQGCAQELYPDQKQHFSFIVCVEKARDPLAAGKRCAKSSGMSWNDIEECAIGAQGKKILARNAHRTLNLSPPNRYVPWITVNGRVRQGAAQARRGGTARQMHELRIQR